MLTPLARENRLGVLLKVSLELGVQQQFLENGHYFLLKINTEMERNKNKNKIVVQHVSV